MAPIVKGAKDPSRKVEYRPPTPSEITGDGGAELFMFVLMALSFVAVMSKMKIMIWAVIFASFSYWVTSKAGVETEQKSILSIVSFIFMGLFSIYFAPQPKPRVSA